MIMSLINGCVSKDIIVNNSSCLAFSPIYVSPLDTIETKKQVLTHNQIYKKICNERLNKGDSND